MNRNTWFLVFIPFVLCHISEKSRECCMYSSDSVLPSCPSNSTCQIRSREASLEGWKYQPAYIHPEDKHCEIISDSKKIKSKTEECYNADFTSGLNDDEIDRSILNQIMVIAYKLNDDTFGADNMIVFGLEILIPYGVAGSRAAWKTAKFRISNNQAGCGDHCIPRCVTIQRPTAHEHREKNETEIEQIEKSTDSIVADYLVYDCELGIYHLPNMIFRPTSGSTYGLEICLDKACQSFLLSMPESLDEESHRILIGKQNKNIFSNHQIAHRSIF